MRIAKVGVGVLLGALLDAQAPSFEVVSIRPSSREVLNATVATDSGDPCSGGADARLQLVNARLVARMTTIYSLVALAYNPWNDAAGGCALARTAGLISGPEWIRSERFAIQALIPSNSPPMTNTQLWAGEAVALQAMLQRMLAERFQFVMHRDTKQVPAYLLTLTASTTTAESRMASSVSDAGGIPEHFAEGVYTGFRTDQTGNRYVSIAFKNESISRLAQRLSSSASIQRPVLDRTGLSGAFSFVLEFDENGIARPSIFNAVQQLGLRLQPATAGLPVLVIDRIERPSEN